MGRAAGTARCIAVMSAAVLSVAVSAGVAGAETRSLSFYNTHTSERATIVFKRDGVYDQAGLKQLNHLLRDWRRNEETRMDPELFDLIWNVYRDVGASEPINIVCGYRAPETNNMLHNRSRGVAKHSQHMLGHALDFFIPGVDLTKLRYVGMKQQYGGVGIYYGSNFVHMDVGSVRTWPNRLSRDQLLALFPDGRTLHLPSDGGPLPGYTLAMADFKRNHPNRGQAEWSDDEDGVARPTGETQIALAAPPAPKVDPAPAPAAAPVAPRLASSVIAADGDQARGAGSIVPVSGPLAMARPPVKPALAEAAPTGGLFAAIAQPRPKPQLEGADAPLTVAYAPQQKPVAPSFAPALANGPRPSNSAADALAALAGEDAPAGSRLLGYAPQPTGPAGSDRTLIGEPVNTVASIGNNNKVVLASLPPSGQMPGQPQAANRQPARAAAKADRADPLARLVAHRGDGPDLSYFMPVSLLRPAGQDPLVSGDRTLVTPLITPPRQVVVAGFRPSGPGTSGAFFGPAVAAVPTLSLE
jgi:uncharacterized protein YcbK (DUF882 family)